MGSVFLAVSDFTRALCAFSTSALPAGGLFLVIVPMLFYAMGDAHFFAGLVFVAVTQTYAGYRLFYLPFALQFQALRSALFLCAL